MRTDGTLRRVLKAALTGLAVVLVVLGVTESMLHAWQQRAGNPDHYVPDAILGYRFRSGVRTTGDGSTRYINREGLYSAEVPEEKGAGEVRILFLGDSITCGYYMHEEFSVPSKTGGFLNQDAPRPRYRTINGAVPGFSALQGLLLLDRVGPLYRPDVIVVTFLNNDRCALPYKPAPTDDLGLLARSALYDSELYRLRFRAMFRGGTRVPRPYSPDPLSADYDASWRANLRAFDESARRLGARVLYVEEALVFSDPTPGAPGKPRTPPSMSPERRDEMVAMLRQETEGRGLPLVRITEDPGFAEALPTFFVPDDLFHPSESGAEFMAGTIARALRSHGLLPGDQQPVR